MGREIYQHHMEQRLRDLSFQIASVKARLDADFDGRLKTELAGQLAFLENRRDQVREKLNTLEQEPDGTWEDLKAEIEDEWDALVQDFEERVANLA
jgi:DNA-binding transcriptional MerR regulator